MKREVFSFDAVAPARERGLKLLRSMMLKHMVSVAPARERGLKLLRSMMLKHMVSSLPQGSVD